MAREPSRKETVHANRSVAAPSGTLDVGEPATPGRVGGLAEVFGIVRVIGGAAVIGSPLTMGGGVRAWGSTCAVGGLAILALIGHAHATGTAASACGTRADER